MVAVYMNVILSTAYDSSSKPHPENPYMENTRQIVHSKEYNLLDMPPLVS